MCALLSGMYIGGDHEGGGGGRGWGGEGGVGSSQRKKNVSLSSYVAGEQLT